VAGKTGTAQVAGKGDYSWYASFAPANDPKYVVVVMIEQGGEGAAAAAPAARVIYNALYNVKGTVVGAWGAVTEVRESDGARLILAATPATQAWSLIPHGREGLRKRRRRSAGA